jgi:hypothetical protein
MGIAVIGTCKLCQRPNQELQDSHLIPAGMYRRVRGDDPKEPHPVIFSERGQRTSCEQITDYVFCSHCESRFAKGGEDYVLRRVQARDRFRLLEELQSIPASLEKREWRGYAASDTPDIDRNKIGYFALSVFWRASVHTWRWKDGDPVRLDLGTANNEALRKYLLGEAGVPSTVALILVVCSDSLTQRSFYMPTLSQKDGNFCWTYGFTACGLFINLHVSKRLPKNWVDSCLLRSEEGWIWLRDCESKTLEGIAGLIARQPPEVREHLWD